MLKLRKFAKSEHTACHQDSCSRKHPKTSLITASKTTNQAMQQFAMGHFNKQ